MLTPRPPWVPAWDSLERASAGAGRALHGVLRCVPVLHRRTDRPGTGLHRRPRRVGQHRGDRRVGQRRQLRGWQRRAPSTRAACRTSTASGSRRCTARIDEIGGPLSHNNYPWGGPWRETHRSSDGSGRCTRAAWPIPASSVSPLGSRGAPAVACAASSPMPSTSLPTVLELVGIEPPDEIDGIAQSHLDGTSFAYLLGEDGADEPGRHRHPALRDARLARHLPRRVEGGDLSTRSARSTTTVCAANAPLDEDVWELYHVAEDVSEARDLRRRVSRRVAELVELWWEEAGATTCSPSTTGSWRRWSTSTTDAGPRRPSATSRTAPRCPSGWLSTCATAPTRFPSPSRSPTVSVPIGHAARARLRPGWLVAPCARRPSALRAQPARASGSTWCGRDGAGLGPPPGGLPLREGRGTRRPGHLVVDGDVVVERAAIDALHPCGLQRGRDRAHLRLRMGARGG